MVAILLYISMLSSRVVCYHIATILFGSVLVATRCSIVKTIRILITTAPIVSWRIVISEGSCKSTLLQLHADSSAGKTLCLSHFPLQDDSRENITKIVPRDFTTAALSKEQNPYLFILLHMLFVY